MVRRMIHATAIVMALGLVIPDCMFGAEPQEPKPLVVSPAKPDRESLRYLFVPDPRQQKAGNAATSYNRVFLSLASRQKEEREAVVDLLEASLADDTIAQAEAILESHRQILTEAYAATMYSHCEWQFPIGQGNDFAILLPEAMHQRELGQLMALDARVAMARGEWDRAARILQSGYSLARHSAEGELIISLLIGAAIANIMNDCVEQWIATPDSPNLYWALSSLPRPLLDLTPAALMERRALESLFPRSESLLREGGSPEQWQRAWNNLWDSLDMIEGTNNEFSKQFTAVGLSLLLMPRARAWWIERGKTVEELNAMPIPQVLLTYVAARSREEADQGMKWMLLPFPEAARQAETADEHYRKLADNPLDPLGQIIALIFPALKQVAIARTSVDRRIVTLRAIESLRAEAAELGHWPESLEGLALPVSRDPLTDLPLVYEQADERTARLSYPQAPEGWPDLSNYARTWELTLHP
jgi:hypothetical protein